MNASIAVPLRVQCVGLESIMAPARATSLEPVVELGVGACLLSGRIHRAPTSRLLIES